MNKISDFLLLTFCIAGSILCLFTCTQQDSSFSPASASAKGPTVKPGNADITVSFGRVGCLGDRAAAPLISMQSLQLELTAKGEIPVVEIFAASGCEAITVSQRYRKLAAEEWKLEVESRDLLDSIIHAASTKFTVVSNQTAHVTLEAEARHSMLRASVFPVRDSVTGCELLVDGTIVVDSLFAKQSLVGEAIPLYYNYVPAEQNRNIRLDVSGDMWGFDTLLYTGDTTMTVEPGVDAAFGLTLDWVGPSAPPPGQAAMNAILGKIGTVSINAQLEDNL